MAGQFELGSKHVECAKLAAQNLSEIQVSNQKEIAKNLLEKTYGFIPADSQVYDDYLGLTVAIEEIAKVSPDAAAILVDQVVIREMIKAYGEDKANSVLTSTESFGMLCSEAGMTSISNISTKAVRNNGQWSLNGVKQASNEQLSVDNYFVLAQDEEGLIRIFVVPASQINVNKVNKNIGSAKVELNQAVIEVTLDDNAHVGIINDEMDYVQSVAKTLIAANAVGIGHSALISSINVCKEVKNDQGQAISTSQSAQFALADMFSEIEASRMLTYLSANSIDEKKANIKQATMAKVKASDIAAKASVDTLHILGNIGYIANTDFANVVMRAVDTQVKGGTNRNQMSKIYQYMLAKK